MTPAPWAASPIMRASWPAPTTPTDTGPVGWDSINTTVTISVERGGPHGHRHRNGRRRTTREDARARRGAARTGLHSYVVLADLRTGHAHRLCRGRTRVPGPRPRYRRRADPNASPDDAGGPSAHRARGHRRSTLAGHRPLAQGGRRGHVGHLVRSPGELHGGVPRSPRADAAWRTRQRPRGASERGHDRCPRTRGRANSGALGGGPGAENARDGRDRDRRDVDVDDGREDPRHARGADDQRSGDGGRSTHAPRRVQLADLGDERRRRHHGTQ
jgi:hypothetical protein